MFIVILVKNKTALVTKGAVRKYKVGSLVWKDGRCGLLGCFRKGQLEVWCLTLWGPIEEVEEHLGIAQCCTFNHLAGTGFQHQEFADRAEIDPIYVGFLAIFEQSKRLSLHVFAGVVC